MNINFKEVDSDNWEECVSLELEDKQEDFLESNSYSLLQAQFEEELYPYCIYDEDEMIGFLMYGEEEPELNRIEMCRLMIDKKYQNKGYGRKVVNRLLDFIEDNYGHIKFYARVNPENDIAKNLYEDLGFKDTGEILWDEEIMAIQL